ncbi:MAG: S1C family serine protease [Candidatus Moraniibacteriota bacterium]|jgi:serine protease Do
MIREDAKNIEIPVMSLILVTVVGFLAGVVGSAVVYSYVNSRQLNKVVTAPQTIIKEVTQLQDDSIVKVVEDTMPSVVSIIATKNVPQYQGTSNSPFNFLFTPNQRVPESELKTKKQKVGGGTGFFVSNDGMIVTNRHVVLDANAEYTVITSDGKEYLASVLARDDVMDFAVLQIEGDNFSAADLGNSDSIKIGQTVIAIGNSLGEFSNSVSRGIVSGIKRNIVAGNNMYGQVETLSNIIQTDAAINFGNSGGPLLDLEGKVIGINTAVAQGAENIGFAIPINQVMKLIEDVKDDGRISKPFVGVRYVIMTPEIKKELNIPYDEGILIVRGQNIVDFAVLPGSPADKAGIVEYDVILEVNGEKITKDNSLSKIIRGYSVGEEINLKIWHGGEEQYVVVVLEDKYSLSK